ncbi:MAG: S1C family serine protease [Planctomycetota bacterium]|jgi:serine protease Do
MPRTFRLAGCLLLCLALSLGYQSSLRAEARSSYETIDHVLPRMVKIFGAGGMRSLAAYGTGFLVSREGHIVTVWSHVLDPDEVIVVLNDGRRFLASVLGADPNLDLAVLKLNVDDRELDLPHFSLTNEIGSASEGTRVLAFSNMFKVATGDEPVSVVHGVIAAKTKLQARRGRFEVPYAGAVYVIDAATNNSGAAGGLLTTREGRLLGMIGRELRNAETNTWVNYSIPLTNLSDAVQQIISGNYRSSAEEREAPVDARTYDPTDFGIVMVPDVLFRTPAYVDRTLSNSDARRLGLKPDDLVLFVDDELVQSIREMKDAIGRIEAGDTLRLTIRRDDQLKTFEFRVPKK